MMRIVLSLALSLCLISAYGQYLGAGKGNINVTSSSSYQDPYWPSAADDVNTVNGSGMMHEYFQAHRFLTQASIGFEENHVQAVVDLGYESWIDAQMAMPPSFITPEINAVFNLRQNNIPAGEDPHRRPDWRDFNYAWWQVNSSNSDLLRHKVAAALSEIFVISRNSEVGQYGDGMADYYDMLMTHAFGTYDDLLMGVSTHAMMGHYLSHANNPKTDGDIHPDENYAREIMQLFSVGLYELNLNGTRKQSGGNDIATYDNGDIAEMAKIFTGFGYFDVIPELTDPENPYDDEPRFGMGLYNANVTEPMRMYDVDDPTTMYRDEDQHEDGPKTLLNGFPVPAGQTGMEDVAMAIDHLSSHPNIAPFIGYRLIQRLVKSNPSIAYVQRVSQAFNGSGLNLGAMVKAILMDPEARALTYQDFSTNSKLKETLFRYTQFSRMVDKYQVDDLNWNINYRLYQEAKQDLFASPSVFNFFLYDDSPNGPIQDAGLVAPEFKIHDSRSSVGYFNTVFNPTRSWGSIMSTWESWISENTTWVIDDLLAMSDDAETWINWLDQHILGGAMSDSLRENLREMMNVFSPNIMYHNARENRVRLGMHLVLISPDYAVMR